MAVTPTEVDSGSQTATLTTLHTLNSGSSPRTLDAIVVLRVNISAMLMGDHVEFVLGEEIQNASETQVDQIIGEVVHARGDNKWWVSPPCMVFYGWDFKLRQTVGTGRAFPWNIGQL